MRWQRLFRFMSPIIRYLPQKLAEAFGISMIQNSPDTQLERFVFEGMDIGARADEDVIVTYERRPKATTLRFDDAGVTDPRDE
jgi:hypothetical protein